MNPLGALAEGEESFKKKKYKNSFLGVFFIGIVEIPSPQIVKYLPWTYKKLHCIGEPYRFSG